MVKPDVKKNYYADLELLPDASLDDVRKQYRKLALKFHPDRNAGKEGECVPRFQAIQSAFEVLGDTDSRNKYDIDRRKAGLHAAGGRPPPRTADSFTGAFNNNPPPRPTPRYSPPGAHDHTRAAFPGAHRYANFKPSPAGQAHRRDASSSSSERSNVFSAWQNMNPHAREHGNARYQRAAPQRAAPTAAAAAAAHPPQPQPPPQPQSQPGWEVPRPQWRHKEERSANQPGVQRAQTTRGRKPFGFDPQAQRGDEPRNAGPTAYTQHPFPGADRLYAQHHAATDFPYPQPNSHPPQSTTDFPPPPPRGRPVSSGRPDPINKKIHAPKQDVNFVEGTPRPHMPYPSAAGERTSLSSEGHRRSASTRPPPQRPTSSYVPGYGDSAKAAARGRHRSLSPTPARKVHTDPPMGSNAAYDDPPKTANSTQPSFVPYSPTDEETAVSDTETIATKDFARKGRASDPESSAARGEATAAATADRSKTFPSERFVNSPLRQTHSAEQDVGRKGSADASAASVSQEKPSIFTFPIGDNTFATTQPRQDRKSRSAETIKTDFSNTDWQGTFTGSSNFGNPPASSGSRTRPPKNGRSRRGSRASPTKVPPATTSVNGDAAQMPPPSRDAPDASPSQGEVKFSAEEWNKQFKEPSWAYPAKPPSPSRDSSANTQRSKTPNRKGSTAGVKVPNAPKQATVNDAVDEEDGEARVDSGAASMTSGGSKDADVDAMDLDTPPQQAKSDNAPPEQHPRLVSVPPTRPDWRRAKSVQYGVTTTQPQPTLRTDLSDLANTAPLKEPASGLTSAADLKSTLPFPSQANATAHPTKGSFQALRLALPDPPKPPQLPDPKTNSARLSKSEWDALVAAMASYVHAWALYNARVVSHLHTRQCQLEELSHASLAAPAGVNWLAATGEPADKPGFDSYLQGLRQDEWLREAWNVASERHKDVVEAFGRVRDRVRALGLMHGQAAFGTAHLGRPRARRRRSQSDDSEG